MNMDFDKLRTLPGITQEELDQLKEGILALVREFEEAIEYSDEQGQLPPGGLQVVK